MFLLSFFIFFHVFVFNFSNIKNIVLIIVQIAEKLKQLKRVHMFTCLHNFILPHIYTKVDDPKSLSLLDLCTSDP